MLAIDASSVFVQESWETACGATGGFWHWSRNLDEILGFFRARLVG